MKKFKKILSIVMIAAVIASVFMLSTVSTGASGTGAGLAEWAMKAYNEGWDYVWGGDEPGGVDCSGLIYSYAGGYRGGDDQTFSSDWRYSLNGSIPNIHGLGLYKPGHVGVYVGNEMAVDARGSQWGVCYESVWTHGWTQYFKVPGVSYPTTGWVQYYGDYYYYENGEYLADTSRTIDGTTYYFGSDGASSTKPSSTSSKSSSSSSASSSSSSSSDNGPMKKGSTGSKVEKLQARLLELGYYNGAVDGDFGANTEKAFKLFQQTAGLYADGIAGSDAELLYSDDAPSYSAVKSEEEDDDAVVNTKRSDSEIASIGANNDADNDANNQSNNKNSEDSPVKYSKGEYSDDIAALQQLLIDLGYLNGTADGEFGAKTEDAVKAFQAANGLEATGVADQALLDKITSAEVKAAKTADAPVVKAPADTDNSGNDSTVSPLTSSRSASSAAGTTSSAPDTGAAVSAANLSGKGVAAVAESPIFRRGADATNFEFILWLAIMIVVMLVAFSVVYVIEKKRRRNAYQARRFS